ncbi:MAG: insulinase family protein [Bacteriovorax sp.]|nr:insulinase family protein [Rhizobacter sp.]
MSLHRVAWMTWRAALRALLASAMVLAFAARAQPFESAPEPAAPRPLTIAAPTEQRLPNGLRVVLAARPGVRLVTAQLLVLSGSEADPPKRAGLSSMTSGLLTKGTRQRSASAQAREAESLGGALESSAGWHQSQVSITVTVPQLDRALALVGDAAMHPRFAPIELARLRGQALDSLKVAYSQPATLAALEADHRLFGAHPYGHPVEGTPASLRRITRADLAAFHQTRYRPDNAVLVLAGDIDDATALRLAARHFGTWNAAREAMPASVASWAGVAATTSPATVVVVDMPKADQAAVVFALPLPPLRADRATAAVMNAVLGGDFSSRLNQQIRIQRGLSYGVGSRLDARPLGGALRIGVQARSESVAEVVALVHAELDGLMVAPVPEVELAARKSALIGTFGRSLETTAGLADAVRSLVVAGLPVDELQSRAAKLAAVTAEEVQQFAAGHLGTARRRVVVAGAVADFGAALSNQAALVVVKPDTLEPERGAGLADK